MLSHSGKAARQSFLRKKPNQTPLAPSGQLCERFTQQLFCCLLISLRKGLSRSSWLVLTSQPGLARSVGHSSCLGLPNAGITGMYKTNCSVSEGDKHDFSPSFNTGQEKTPCHSVLSSSAFSAKQGMVYMNEKDFFKSLQILALSN